jgi:ribonuclease HI
MPPWQPDEHITLANGLVVCGAHGQVICHRCCVDYSSMLDQDDDEVETIRLARVIEGQHGQWDDESEMDSGKVDEDTNEDANIMLQILSQDVSMTHAQLQYRDDGALIVPDIRSFVSPTPTVTPQQLFPLQRLPEHQWPRFTHRSNHNTLLIYTDGACLNNGQADPAAGWGFVFREPTPQHPSFGRVSGRVEDRGPSGEPHPQTSNRAELRAVIAALQFRAWFGEGWKKLVIATDSEYVTEGATKWVRTWGRNGWVTSNGTAVKNRDLWEELLSEVIGHRQRGIEICFWRIPRAWNTGADHAAKVGAREERRRDFTALTGMAC